MPLTSDNPEEPAAAPPADQQRRHLVTGPGISQAVQWAMCLLLLIPLVVLVQEGIALEQIRSAGGWVALPVEPPPWLSWAGEAGRQPVIVPFSKVGLEGCPVDDKTWHAVLHLAGRGLEVALLDGTGLTDRQLAELTEQSPGLYSLSALNSRLTDQGLASLASCPNLKCLSIGSPALSPGWSGQLPSLPSLKLLGVSGLKWNEAAAAALSQFENLQWLILTRVTFEAKLSATDTPPSGPLIEKLTIKDSSLTEAGLQLISGYESLRWLRCDDVTFPAASCHHLARLQQVHYIFLYDCQVNALCLQALSTLPEVTELRLRGTNVMDDHLQHLASLPKLKTLSLWNTPVSDAAIPHLVRCRGLKVLHLSGSRVSASGLVRLRGSLPGCRISHHLD